MTPTTLRTWRESNGLSRRAADERLGLPPRSTESLEQGRVTSPIAWGLLARLIPLLHSKDSNGCENTR